MNKYCFSGGATGSDLAWGAAAKRAGYQPIHFSFEGHRTQAPPAELRVIEPDVLKFADTYLQIANKKLKRAKIVDGSERASLLRRNFFQVIGSNAVYAVAVQTFSDGTVAGGTGWAVEMAVGAFNAETERELLPIFVFDQTRTRWLQLANRGEPWRSIDHPPAPPDRFTGIGTRRLNSSGRRAIERVFSE